MTECNQSMKKEGAMGIGFLWVILLLQLCACQVPHQEEALDDAPFKVELGHYLFFEKRLSMTGTKSCGSCHDPRFAFTDGYRKSPGAYADLHFRNTPSLLNINNQKYFNRANTDITSVYQQMDGPLFGVNPIEMGLSETDTRLLATLSQEPIYKNLFQKAFPSSESSISWDQIKQALAAYVHTLNASDSPYDRYLAGDEAAIDEAAKAGEKLFFSNRYKCSSCHRPPHFSADSTLHTDEQFANIGLYNDKSGNYPLTDQGLYRITGLESDKGKFKIPTLRNLAFTAPYFHDGSAETLHEVLDVYENGGRDVPYGPWKGDGKQNPYKSKHINGIKMSNLERSQMIAFLHSLNDSTIILNKNFEVINTHTLNENQ
jgi:cytochrome c peroxidase